MLHVCAEHIDEKADHQAAAVLGIALVTLGEDVGSEMALRTYDHLLHYGGLPIRRAVPLGLALMNIRYTLLVLLVLLLLLLTLPVRATALYSCLYCTAMHCRKTPNVAACYVQCAYLVLSGSNHTSAATARLYYWATALLYQHVAPTDFNCATTATYTCRYAQQQP
jgi:hypothetical protein